MDDQLNVPLEDAELLAEVELTTNLIIAASEAEAPCRRPRSTGCWAWTSPADGQAAAPALEGTLPTTAGRGRAA